MNPFDSLLSDLGLPQEKPKNPQLYENSPFPGSAVESEYEARPDRLYADRQPNLAIRHEKPEHRMCIFLKAQGLSNNEIARRMGLTYAWVSQVLRQPWARIRLLEELNAQGRDAVGEAIRSAALDSVYTLIDIRDSEKAPPAVRKASADSLLDRFLGKPTQVIRAESEVTHINLGSSEDIDARLKALDLEERRLLGL